MILFACSDIDKLESASPATAAKTLSRWLKHHTNDACFLLFDEPDRHWSLQLTLISIVHLCCDDLIDNTADDDTIAFAKHAMLTYQDTFE